MVYLACFGNRSTQVRILPIRLKSRSGKYDYIILKMATLRVCGFESHSGYPDGGIGRRGPIFVLEILSIFASVAQLVEHLICNQEVVGSIPSGGSKNKKQTKMKTVIKGQFEGSRKYLRGHYEKKEDSITRLLKRIIKRTRKVKN